MKSVCSQFISFNNINVIQKKQVNLETASSGEELRESE